MGIHLSAATIEPKPVGKLGVSRGARNLPVLRVPEPWEFELLRLIAEQGAIPVDQLARFLGVDVRQVRPWPTGDRQRPPCSRHEPLRSPR